MGRNAVPAALLLVFEAIAIALWLAKDNAFYLLNFSNIGVSMSLEAFLFIQGNKHTRRITQLLVGMNDCLANYRMEVAD